MGILDHLKKYDTDPDAKRRVRELYKKDGVEATYSEGSNLLGPQAGFDGDVYNTKEYPPEILAHELGHVKKPENIIGRANRRIAPASNVLGISTSVSAPIVAAMDHNPSVGKTLGTAVLPAIASTPAIAEEVRANYHANKKLKEIYKDDPEKLKRSRRNLGKAFSTYLAAPVLGGAATIGVGLMKNRMKGEDDG